MPWGQEPLGAAAGHALKGWAMGSGAGGKGGVGGAGGHALRPFKVIGLGLA